MTRIESKRVRGFSSIEFVACIFIISAVVLVLISHIGFIQKKTYKAQTVVDMHNIRQALEMYYIRHGHYPVGDEAVLFAELNSLYLEGGVRQSSGFYVDPWEKPYGYRYPTNDTGYALFSKSLDSAGASGAVRDLSASGDFNRYLVRSVMLKNCFPVLLGYYSGAGPNTGNPSPAFNWILASASEVRLKLAQGRDEEIFGNFF